jgi:hypothetical protein
MQSEEAKRLERSIRISSKTTATAAATSTTSTTINDNDKADDASSFSSMPWNTMNTGTALEVDAHDYHDDHDKDRNAKQINEGERGLGQGDGTDADSELNLISYRKKTKHAKDSFTIYDQLDVQTKAEKYLETSDDYLDNPLPHTNTYTHSGSSSSISRTIHRFFKNMQSHLLAIHNYLYGDKIPPSEIIRTLCLSSTLFFMIGGYWLLRSLKDPVLTALCGVTAIPKAKMLSVLVVLVVGKLLLEQIDLVSASRVCHIASFPFLTHSKNLKKQFFNNISVG